ncbi:MULTISPECIES: GntR family transcriptional regulator [unclassified Microbacterium]|uniref:GntR family transcriptional regulator n=1 Tax=unclassified Microbacterium TaxID=2609290 RepID=UPI00214B8BEE|nr:MULTISPECIES: GntR family transcriptional regulator [unclassified Microbacterium]MCR2810954.1 GntR family transcriptional regulator [Microbacterium sp. zg.B185]WIM19647.1 GntR family transcriptional regulator [Microbacterium sp. zg-B185]
MTDSPAILGLQRNTLRMQAIEVLRRAITTGELPPGSHVSEIEMSQRLQISRGTLREAMRTLQIEGLLTEGSRGRLLVRRMDDEELRDLFLVRAALEALAARTVAESPQRESAVESLRAAVGLMSAAENESLDARMRADLDFHRELCRLTGNDTLMRAWSALEGSILMSITRSGIERAVRNMDVPRHLEIVDAIATGDPDTAAAAVAQHMELATQTLIA